MLCPNCGKEMADDGSPCPHCARPTGAATTLHQRHGCLTAYLIFMMIANAGTALVYLLAADTFRRNLPNAPSWTFPLLIAMGCFNLACAVGLWLWKKWGFWGYCFSSVAGLAVNLVLHTGIAAAIFGFVGLFLLFGVLHIGKGNKGWPQLS